MLCKPSKREKILTKCGNWVRENEEKQNEKLLVTKNNHKQGRKKSVKLKP